MPAEQDHHLGDEERRRRQAGERDEAHAHRRRRRARLVASTPDGDSAALGILRSSGIAA